MTRATVSADGETITVHIPLVFKKRSGRKLVVTPDGAAWAPRPRVDNAMLKALARAFRWRKMLDEGVHATLVDLARAKRLPPSYVSGILRLTLFAPEIVEAILDGRQPAVLQLDDLLEGFPLDWEGRYRVSGRVSGRRGVDRNGKARSDDAPLVRHEHCLKACGCQSSEGHQPSTASRCTGCSGSTRAACRTTSSGRGTTGRQPDG